MNISHMQDGTPMTPLLFSIIYIFTSVFTNKGLKLKYLQTKRRLLPPQGFRQEAKSRGGTLVARTYIKDSTYSSNMQSVY